MAVLTKCGGSICNAAAGIGVISSLLGAATLFMTATALAGNGAPEVIVNAHENQTLEAVLGTDDEGFSEGSRLQVGMPIEQAMELLGGSPDDETEVGAACGMLDIMTWDDNGTQLISVDGTVTSIVKDGTVQD